MRCRNIHEQLYVHVCFDKLYRWTISRTDYRVLLRAVVIGIDSFEIEKYAVIALMTNGRVSVSLMAFFFIVVWSCFDIQIYK
jgi:hypothetical protein